MRLLRFEMEGRISETFSSPKSRLFLGDPSSKMSGELLLHRGLKLIQSLYFERLEIFLIKVQFPRNNEFQVRN